MHFHSYSIRHPGADIQAVTIQHLKWKLQTGRPFCLQTTICLRPWNAVLMSQDNKFRRVSFTATVTYTIATVNPTTSDGISATTTIPLINHISFTSCPSLFACRSDNHSAFSTILTTWIMTWRFEIWRQSTFTSLVFNISNHNVGYYLKFYRLKVCASNNVTNWNQQSLISYYIPKSITLICVLIWGMYSCYERSHIDLKMLLCVLVYFQKERKVI
jgi:hypothetical protein